MSVRTRAAHVARGGLIGAAEAVPGISGGTVALVTGVYDAVISSAGHVVSGLKALITDRPRARAEFAAVRWDVVVPLLVGMAPALLVALLMLGPAVEQYPVQLYSLFLGMVAASLLVPIGMVRGRWRLREVIAAGLGLVAAFLITSAPQLATDEPSRTVVFFAAAIAVCALVFPGLSGSYLLLIFGIYTPTVQALRELNVGYIAVFLLGMAVGLSLFVKALQWLLTHHRRVTLATMIGMILGSLRALWPWQTEQRQLLAPDAHVPAAVVLFLLGAAAVLAVMMLGRRRSQSVDEPAAPERYVARHARR